MEGYLSLVMWDEKPQNGALQGYPLGEVDLEHFYKRNLIRFAMVALGSHGLPGLPKWLPRAPKGFPTAPGGEVGGENNFLLKWRGI